jgi:hypothetical protein
MPDDLPVPSGDNPLPTMSDWIANWLGFQLPAIPMPQTVKNLDKAVGKILLAAGENAEARIKSNTGKTKAKGKIEVEGMYRTEEEKRKLENRAAAVKVAIDEINESSPEASYQDAKSEIEDDWLNLFSRLAEDKSSEELQSLFGKILAGEIKRPGSFSLRTIQLLGTLSKKDAETVSDCFSFVLNGLILPFRSSEVLEPSLAVRLFMENLGLAGHPNKIGGFAAKINVQPNGPTYIAASKSGVLIQNKTDKTPLIQIPGQIISETARELLKIANPKITDMEFLKEMAKLAYDLLRANHAEDVDKGDMSVHAVVLMDSAGNVRIFYTAAP